MTIKDCEACPKKLLRQKKNHSLHTRNIFSVFSSQQVQYEGSCFQTSPASQKECKCQYVNIYEIEKRFLTFHILLLKKSESINQIHCPSPPNVEVHWPIKVIIFDILNRFQSWVMEILKELSILGGRIKRVWKNTYLHFHSSQVVLPHHRYLPKLHRENSLHQFENYPKKRKSQSRKESITYFTYHNKRFAFVWCKCPSGR